MADVSVTNNSLNLSASTKTSNLLLGTDLAFAPADGIVTIHAVASASGVNIEAGVGSDKVISDREIIFIGTTLIADGTHEIGSFEVTAGSPLSLFLRETLNVSTSDVLWKVDFDYA